MTETSFTESLAALAEADGAFTAPAPPNWMQGRTAYGGYTAAILLAAAERAAPDLPPLRSALINFTGPVSAPPRIRVEALRRGRNVTTVEARAEIDGALAALGVFSFGAARDSEVDVDLPAPPAAAPDALSPFHPPEAAAFLPRFTHEFDVRLIDGHRPVSGADEGYVRCWIRHKDPAARAGQTGLLALADMLPPAVYPLLRRMGPNSSMTWICNFLTEDFATEDGWWHCETRLSAARGGYSSQVMRIWDAEGRLVVDGMQAVAVFA